MQISFLTLVSTLKRIPRSGWISHGISLYDVESVADHTFSTCALSMLLTDLEQGFGVEVNGERVLKIATIHDLAESLTFDISKGYLKYLGKRGSAMKNEIETTAWKHLIRGMESDRLSQLYLKLQEEYLRNRTIEAQIVHAADSLDILLQITDLRRRGYPIRLMKDLWDQTLARLRDTSVRSARKLLKPIVEENRRLR